VGGNAGGTEAAIAPKPPASTEALPPPEDPTKKAVTALVGATDRELDEARTSDRRALAMESARQASVAESGRWKRRELLVRQQIAGLADRASKLETEAEALDAERDVLARERDAS
jgi:hypothetical protein